MSRKVVIIGAGVAGLICAKRLMESGFKVSIFDKSRGLGGRVATRRIENGVFNHGAPRIPDFRNHENLPKYLKNLLETALKKKILISTENYVTSFASMKTFVSFLSQGTDIHKNSEITSVKRKSFGVEVNFKNSSRIRVNDEFLVFAIPQPQVLNLLSNDFPKLINLAQPAKMYASISGLFAFDTAISLNKPFVENDYILGFHENSRIGQIFDLDCWTIHSKKNYGKKFNHLSKVQIKERLFKDFEQLGSSYFPQPVYAEGHRWLYGFTEKALDKNFIFNKQEGIGICGDWCLGNTVLDALISGTLLADKIVASVID